MKIFLLATAALLLNSAASYAQWNATLNIVPYPSPYVSDWENNISEIGQLIIYSNSNNPEKVRIRSVATLEGTGKVFEGTSDEITVQPGIPEMIDVTKLIKFGEATFPEKHLKNQSVETGRLPEGHYELSVAVLNPSNPQTPFVSNVVADFTIIYPDPPSLIFPDQDGKIASDYPTFQWTPVTVPPDYTIYYSLKIVQVLDGQTPQRALEANIPQFERDHLTTTTFTYPIDALPLDTGKTYAWQITALDQNNFPPTHNNGKSQIYTFTYKGQSSGMIHVLGPGKPDTTGHTHSATEALTMAGSGCPGGTPGGISHTDIDASRVSQINQLTIDGFLIHPDQIQLQSTSGHTYQGTGYITWNPFGSPSPIKLAVSFNDIKINTDREVYQGTVTTTITDNSEVSAWTSLASASTPGAINDGSKTSSQYGSFDAYLSAPTHSIRSISGNTPVDFPLALRNQSLSSTSPLALMGITFTPNGASMNVLYNLNIPDADKWISFFNTCLPVTPDGIGISSGHSAVLYLPNDVSMTLSDGTFRFKNSSPADTAGGTYVKWNSDGLQTVVAAAERSFSQSDIKPLSDDGTAMGTPETMQLAFTFTNWNDWIARATPDHDFEIAGLPGFSISASGSGFYDHSTNRNPGSLNSSNFPLNYTGNKLDGSFEGLYFHNLTMSLPDGFKTFGSGSDNRISFPFNNFILSENLRQQGVTVDINKSVLPFPPDSSGEEGDLGGWPFSIDNININIAHNQRGSDMSMSGKLKLPLSSSGTIDYTCNMNTGAADGINYNFNVSNLNGRSYPLDVWPATMNLQTSTMTITHESEGIAVTATLNGTMSISISAGHHSPVHVSLPGLPFQNFKITNRDEEDHSEGFGIEDVDIWGADDGAGPDASQSTDNGGTSTGNGESNASASSSTNSGGDEQGDAAGFKATLGKLAFDGPSLHYSSERNAYRLELGIDIELGLGFGESGISGGTKLTLGGDIHDSGRRPPFVDNIGVNLKEISLSGDDLGPLTIKGKLDFFPDASHAFTYSSADLSQYGHGVSGNLEIEIEGLAGIKFHTIFGTVNNGGDPFHYWGVGGSVYLETGIQAGPVEINGFGGGFAYNMKIPTAGAAEINGTTSTSRDANESKLVPRKHSVVISLEAFLSLIRPRIVNAIVKARVGINTNKGFSAVSVSGYGAILAMNPPEDNHPIGSVSLRLLYDYPDQMFDGSLNGNVQLGISSVTLPMTMHAEPHKYYLYIGTPKNRASFTLIKIPPGPAFNAPVPPAGVKVYLGANGYMDMGTQLPSFPQLPGDVLSNLRNAASLKRASDNSVHSLLQLLGAAGNPGFMFGAQLQGLIDVPIMPFILRGSATGKLGFDVALEHISKQDIPVGCLTKKSKKFGLNNWYSIGQLYAYLNMDLTFRPSDWIVGHPDTLLGLTTGAVMQAGFPNPSWADGKVWIDVQTFGGHIRGYKHFKFGNECYTNYNPMDHIRLITKAGPKDTVSVFATPYADFGLPMNGQPMHVHVPPDRNHNQPYTRTYRFKLTQFKLFKVNGNTTIPIQGVLHHNSDRKIFKLIRKNTLQPDTHYKIHIHCYAQEKRRGRWGAPAEGLIVQDTTIYFETGPAPHKIMPQNIVYTYPINGQRYLLKDVFSDKGRIKLGQWQSHILPVQPPGTLEYNYLVKFIPQDGSADTVTTHFTPDKANESLDFHIPSALKNSTTYKMQVWVNPIGLNISPSEIRQQNDNLGLTSAQRQAVQNTMNERARSVLHNNSNQGNSNQSTQSGKTIEIHGIVHPNVSYTPPRKPIYTLRFRTSKFNTFAEKMNALDPLKADREDLSYHIKIYSNNENAEPFDVFEIKGYNSSNTTVSKNENHFQPMFRAYISYDAGNPIDKNYMDGLYNPASRLGAYGFHVDLGAPEVRNNRGFPSFSLSTKDMTYSPSLNSQASQIQQMNNEMSQHPVEVVNAFGLNGGSKMYSFAGMQTMNSAGGFTAGNNVSVPGTYAKLQFHNPNAGLNARMNNYANRSGHGYMNHQGSSGTNIPNSNTPSTTNSNNEYHSFQLVWKRDLYLHEDQELLSQSVHTFFDRTSHLSSSYSFSGSNTLAAGEFGSITFTGGSSFPGFNNRLITSAQMQRITAILDKIPNSFTMLNRLGTSRKIYFQYRYPYPNSGVRPVTIIKHLNVYRLSRQASQQFKEAQQSRQLPAGAPSPPLILQFK